ncbi:hypothetical protein CUR95_24175 [Bordetella bronchiseptica]|nr:hypothetical protein [Bordetella bronchiseptica]
MLNIPAGWKPIESAPKDGTTVILGRDMGAFGFIRGYGYFAGTEGAFVSGWVSKGFCEPHGNLGLANPTHWQPLPAAPGAETPEDPVTVALDPDPRGVSVGVWQGSRCIYTGAHALPASVAPGDAQDERLHQWPTTTARMKALAAELIFAANSMGGGGNDGEDVELVLSVAPAGTILLDEDPDVWNPGSLLTVHTKEYPDAGRYLVDPAQVSSDGTQCPAPTAGEAPPRFTISASDRFELTGAVGLLRWYDCAGAADALQRVLDAESASFSVQGEDDARDAGRYRTVRKVAADKENGYALMAEASREVGIEVSQYPTPEQFDAVVDLVAAQQGKGGEA